MQLVVALSVCGQLSGPALDERRGLRLTELIPIQDSIDILPKVCIMEFQSEDAIDRRQQGLVYGYFCCTVSPVDLLLG